MADIPLNEAREVSIVSGDSDLGTELVINADGSLIDSYNSPVSTLNSSTTILGIGVVFTGTFESVKNYAMLTVSIFTDKASANDGLAFQWSSDGTNVDRTEASSVLANAGRAFSLTVRAQYFRIVYTNGAVAQTSFRLQTVLHSTGVGLITKPLDVVLSTENFALLTQSVIAGEEGGGFVNVKTINGRLLVEASIAESSGSLTNGQIFYASLSSYNLASAGSNNPIFLLRNPADSGKTIYIFSVSSNCRVTNVQVTFLLFKNPTITANGTAFTPVNANFGSSNASVMGVYTASTISASGTLIIADQVGQNTNSSNMILIERIALVPGNDILIAGDPFSNNRAIVMSVGWAES